MKINSSSFHITGFSLELPIQSSCIHTLFHPKSLSSDSKTSFMSLERLHNDDVLSLSKFVREHCTGVCVYVRAKLWSVLKHISRPWCSSCGGRKEAEERRLKCKELPWWRHSDLRGAMETPVMGGGGGLQMLMCLSLQRLTIC